MFFIRFLQVVEISFMANSTNGILYYNVCKDKVCISCKQKDIEEVFVCLYTTLICEVFLCCAYRIHFT